MAVTPYQWSYLVGRHVDSHPSRDYHDVYFQVEAVTVVFHYELQVEGCCPAHWHMCRIDRSDLEISFNALTGTLPSGMSGMVNMEYVSALAMAGSNLNLPARLTE